MWIKLTTDWLVSLSAVTRLLVIVYCKMLQPIDNGRRNCHCCLPIWSISESCGAHLVTVANDKNIEVFVALKRFKFLSLIWSISGCCGVHLVTSTEDKKIYHPFGALEIAVGPIWSQMLRVKMLKFLSSIWSISKCWGTHLITVVKIKTKAGMCVCCKLSKIWVWINCVLTKCVSPWYNCTGWLGVKHQVNYLLGCG